MTDIIRLLHVAAFLPTIPISVNGNDCTKEKFRCDDGSCIPLEQVCDISIDCVRGEDEIQCSPTSCPENLIRCYGECKYECETTTIQLTTIKITTINEANHVTTSTLTQAPFTKPGDNHIITTTSKKKEAGFNMLYLLYLLLIIPIVFIILCIIKMQCKKKENVYEDTSYYMN